MENIFDENVNEKKIIVEISFDKIQKAVYDSVDNILKSTYGNPIKDAVEKAFKEKNNEVQLIIGSVISESLNNPEFKSELGKLVMGKMFENAFKR